MHEKLTVEVATPPTNLNGLPVSQIRAELDSILKSRVFVHSHRIRRFLQFVVEECLNGRQHRLKEYLIGLEVFNRQDDFDPRVDSIVRVEARRLRMKIDEYYEKEGLHNDIRIELRKGSYVPIFAHRDAGTREGYPSRIARRYSISIGQLTAIDGDLALVPGIARKLTHEITKGAQFRVFADGSNEDRIDGINGNGHASPKPDYLLEGRLERDHVGLQVLLQLKDLEENAYVWSDSSGVDGIQDLAGSLNRSLIALLGRTENVRTRPHSTQSESFDFYLKGRYRWKAGSPDSIFTSTALFEQAVAIDPEHAASWGALAEVCMVNSLFGLGDPVESGPKIRAAAFHAMNLAPALPESQVAQGLVESVLDCNWDAGERSFQRAIQLDPRDVTAHIAYSIQLAARGLLRPALIEAQAALELDPASLGIHFILGWLLGISGRHDEAIAQHNLTSRLEPEFALAYLGLGWAYLGKGLVAQALSQFTTASKFFKVGSLLSGCLGHCYGRMSQRDEALRQMAHRPSPICTAAIYAGLGDSQRALAALEQAAEQRDSALAVQLLNPEFDLLRGEPRFTELQEKLGLRRANVRPTVEVGQAASPVSVNSY